MTIVAALLSCTVLGFRHGIDVDHVAAISDVTSVQSTRRDATRCGFLYAAGHAATVGLLGVAVITLGMSIPAAVSVWMERVIGFTLVLLGAYVFAMLFSGRSPVSRGRAVLALFGRLSRTHKQSEPHAAQVYGPRSSLSLGVLHGIGAETPTQLAMLLIAANLGGLRNGVLVLVVFATAMFLSNLVLTTAATSMFAISKFRPVVFRWLGAITAGYSLWIGFVLMAS